MHYGGRDTERIRKREIYRKVHAVTKQFWKKILQTMLAVWVATAQELKKLQPDIPAPFPNTTEYSY